MTTGAPPAVLPLSDAARRGALAGLAGGLVFGAAMLRLGMLPNAAAIIRLSSPVAGFVVHMLIAALVGAGFGILVMRQRAGAGELLFWGLCYGALWWLLGALTLYPVLTGEPVEWGVSAARMAFPSLVGHLLYGATVGLTLARLRSELVPATRRGERGMGGRLMHGGLAGVLATTVVSLAVPGWRAMEAFTVATPWRWLALVLLGAVIGAGYPLLFTSRVQGAGPALIRGVCYGFLCWLVVGLTLPPLLSKGSLDWSAVAARSTAGLMPGYLLAGAGIAVIIVASGGLVRMLFADNVRRLAAEGAGVRSVRAIGHGMLAGIAGGVVFTLVLLPIDVLPVVARLVGTGSPAVGLLVHMLIAQAVGISFTLLFHRHSVDTASAVGWGASYGFFWWVLGPLTLMPLLLGVSPQWNSQVLAASFPSLVGHLCYGVVVGITIHRLELRASPWWLPRSELQSDHLRRHREQLLGSAPALWALTVLIAMLIPLILDVTST
ncbi:MAG: hypothetical protein JOZ47_11475 [Kutzneria sp.]|nr:hypothetical protein [Kutzneria sp.]